jgi:arsenical pump membrane protein
LVLSFPIPEFTKTLVACLIGLLTLVGIMTRPFRWNEAVIAMVGAVVLLVLGLISPVDALFTLIRDWNTFLFFSGDDGSLSPRGGS